MGHRWTVSHSAAPGWRTSETRRALNAKIKSAWKADHKAVEFSGLAGKTLRNACASSVSATASPEDPGTHAALQTYYVLILSDLGGPVGFCAFAVNLDLIDGDQLIAFEVEVVEVFIEPKYRGRDHSHAFCVVIAQFAINAIEELNHRLYKAGSRFAQGITLNIVGDVESRSGQRFLFSIEKELERRKEDSWLEDGSPFQLITGLSIEHIEVDPR